MKQELDDEEEVKWGKMLGQSDRAEKKRKWIAHMILQEDGISDPPGIKVCFHSLCSISSPFFLFNLLKNIGETGSRIAWN